MRWPKALPALWIGGTNRREYAHNTARFGRLCLAKAARHGAVVPNSMQSQRIRFLWPFPLPPKPPSADDAGRNSQGEHHP
jgi:hypothetical protein